MSSLNSRLTEILELAGKLERQEISRIDYQAFSLRLIPQLVELALKAIEQNENNLEKYMLMTDSNSDDVDVIIKADRAELEAILRRV